MSAENSVCRFCLKVLVNNQFEIIENLKLGMLDVLLLQLNFAVSIAPLVCLSCVEKLKQAFNFKTACLSFEQRIHQFLSTSRSLKVDLKEVYLAQADNVRRKAIKEDQKVCRFCLRLLKKCVFNDIGTDTSLTGVLRKYFPEMDLNITKEIDTCPNCLNRLTTNFNFIMLCLETENYIRKYYEMEGIPSEVQIDLRHLSQYVSILKSIDPDSDDYSIDGVENAEENHPLNQNGNAIEDYDGLSQNLEGDTIDQTLPRSPTTKNKKIKTKSTPLKRERHRRACKRIHKCPHCAYKTEYKGSINRHMLQHKNPSELTIYKCPHCSFNTKHKGSCTRHTLAKHNKKTTVYECRECNFKTMSKPMFRIHVDSHRGGAELPTYGCATCPYQTKSKRDIKKHILTHKKKSLSCDSCKFKTENVSDLNTHKLTHQKGSGSENFKCDSCPFTTKHKGNLKSHSLIHKSNDETVMYKCSQCTFETKHKISLKTHMLRHKSPGQVTLYECQVCGFKAKHKGNLKLHEVIHKDPSEAVMYNCERCDFKTKHKMSLRTHMLKHKKRSEVVRHQCEICEFETLHKGNLKKHELIHKDASELTWYRCHLCAFETIHKGSYKTHATSFHPQPEGEVAGDGAESKGG